MIDDTFSAFDTANVKNFTEEESRQNLSNLRTTLFAAYEQERRELQYGAADPHHDHPGQGESLALDKDNEILLEAAYSHERQQDS